MPLQVSTRGRYGVRLMTALALRHGSGVVLLKDIARQEAISLKYLGQIVIPLRTAGLIVSQRGARGGYALARPPQSITAREVLEAIEGPLAVVPEAERSTACGPVTACATSALWRRLSADVGRALASLSLADLVRQGLELSGQGADYVI